MRNVIVTGATGFVGKTLVREIRARFPEANVVAVGTSVVDLSDMHATAAWMEGLRDGGFACDHIIHLAALYKAGDWPDRHHLLLPVSLDRASAPGERALGP